MFNTQRFSLILILLGCTMSLSARGVGDEVSASESSNVPMRIVQVGSAAFIVENALYLFPEASDRIVAVADGNQGNGLFLADLDPDIDSKVILPRSANTETVLSLRPDVVVMKNSMKERMGEPYERVGVSTFFLDLETPEAWMEDLDRLGSLFNNPGRADELKVLFRNRISAVTEPLGELDDNDRPEILLLYWSVKDGVSAVNVPPLDWIQTRMVEMAGGNPVWRNADFEKGWTRVNLEQIAAWNPEMIVVAAYHIPASEAVDAIMADPTWSALRAVREGNVHAFPADYHSWDQPDARWLLGLTWLASVLHPESYPDLDIDEVTRSFYREFFRMDDTAYESMIVPRLSGLD